MKGTQIDPDFETKGGSREPENKQSLLKTILRIYLFLGGAALFFGIVCLPVYLAQVTENQNWLFGLIVTVPVMVGGATHFGDNFMTGKYDKQL